MTIFYLIIFQNKKINRVEKLLNDTSYPIYKNMYIYMYNNIFSNLNF